MLANDAFAGRTALVTGGGTGIGFATARLWVDHGGRVALWGRRAEVVEAAAAKLGDAAVGVSCDIREPEQIDAALARVVERIGDVDTLVNNAGGQFPSPAVSLSPNGFAAVVRNNLLGTWNVTRAVALQCMLPRKRGVIVNVIANIARGFPGMLHTGAARAGVDNMTKTLAIEWVAEGIRVNAVAPGVIATEGLAQYPEEILEAARRGIPMRRLGTPEEAANVVVFLCSDAARYVTGDTWYVDGGARLWGETWPIPDAAGKEEP